jgi:hypothetical protein
MAVILDIIQGTPSLDSSHLLAIRLIRDLLEAMPLHRVHRKDIRPMDMDSMVLHRDTPTMVRLPQVLDTLHHKEHTVDIGLLLQATRWALPTLGHLEAHLPSILDMTRVGVTQCPINQPRHRGLRSRHRSEKQKLRL